MKVHFCLWKSSCLGLFVEKTILAPVNLPLYFCQKSVVDICLNLCLRSILFCDLFFCLDAITALFFILNLYNESWNLISPPFFIVVLAISDFLHFDINSVIAVLVSKCKSLLEFWFGLHWMCSPVWRWLTVYRYFFTSFVIFISVSYF